MLARFAFVAASVSLLPACLTQNVQYDVPRNYPPSIETPDVALFPLNQVIQLPDDLAVESDGGVTLLSALPLVFDVREPNVDQRLEYRVYVDYRPTAPTLATGGVVRPVAATAADRVTRRVDDLMLPIGLVSSPGCHRIEILVSSAFSDDAVGRRPVEEGDLATATWWVASAVNPGDEVNMRDCRPR